MSKIVLTETRDAVRIITLNRPEARNALNTALHRASAAALAQAEDDDDIAVVILTGSDPAFCAGLDLKELGASGANLSGGRTENADEIEARWNNPIQAVWQMTKPVIGAINGACITGGFELALGCDFLVASERAAFGDTHGRVGVTPGGGMSVFLPMAIGLRRAKELTFSGNFLLAQPALEAGLVNHVVPHDELIDFTTALASDIASNDSPTVRHLKKLYDHNSRLAPGPALDHEHDVFRDYKVDFAELERRREKVVERGRTQQ